MTTVRGVAQIAVCIGVCLLFAMLSSRAQVADVTLNTLLHGLRYRDTQLPLASGVYLHITAMSGQSPQAGEAPDSTALEHVTLQAIRFAQMDAGYWVNTYQADGSFTGNHADIKPVVDEIVYSDGERLHRRELNSGEAAPRVMVTQPQDVLDQYGFLDHMFTLRGGGGALADFIAQGNPVIVGTELLGGVSCYVIECSFDEGPMRFWIAPDMQYALLKLSQRFAEPLSAEYVEYATRIEELGGVHVVAATYGSRTRTGTGVPPRVSHRVTTEFRDLREVRGTGCEAALACAVAPLGSYVVDRSVGGEGYWVADLRSAMEVVSSARSLQQYMHARSGGGEVPWAIER